MKFKSLFVLMNLAVLFLPRSADAAVLITNPGSGALTTGGGFTLGEMFTVGANNVSVTNLGVWDENQDGLTTATPVAIWDFGGSLVTGDTVLTGGSATLTGEFRYVSITAVTLNAGATYTIGAYYSAADTDRLHDHSASPTTSPDFNSFAARTTASTGGSIAQPTSTSSGTAYVGPNFQYIVLPEPPAMMLLAIGGLAVLITGKGKFGRRRSECAPTTIRLAAESAD